MADFWADRYREVLAAITGRVAANVGFTARAVAAAETRLGVNLPDALRDYYLSVGRHPLNRTLNRLLAPDDLEVHDRRLVFMEENQWVVHWGVAARTTAADPVVLQTTDLDDGDWSPECRCSQFFPAMMCWQAISGGLPHAGQTDQVPVRDARRAMRGWTPVGRIHELTAFARDGRVACVQGYGEYAQMYLAARNRRDYQAFVTELGVTANEL